MNGTLLLACNDIDEYSRIEPSGYVIENSPVNILPSSRVRVPESKTISRID